KVGDDHGEKRIRLQVSAGNAVYVLQRDRFDFAKVLFGGVETEAKEPRLSHEEGNLGVAVETEREAAGEIAHGVVELCLRDAAVAHADQFQSRQLDRLRHGLVLGLHDDAKASRQF